jgi:hypothetical protein
MITLFFALSACIASAAANVDLEFRAESPSVFIGDEVRIALYASSDIRTSEIMSAMQVIFTWNTNYLDLVGLDSAGGAAFTFSGFPTIGSFGLNEAAIPQDGDGLYLGLSFAGVAALPGPGTLITTLVFDAIAPVAITGIGMPATGGVGGTTTVASGVVPGLDITGTLTGTSVAILSGPLYAAEFNPGAVSEAASHSAPAPPSALLLLACFVRRRARVFGAGV